MNGGDRNKSNITEMNSDLISNIEVEFRFSVGGDQKLNASSKILEEWKFPRVKRNWGSYRILDKQNNWAVKELILEPGKSLSDQRHSFRSEHWHIVEGLVNIDIEHVNGEKETL